MKLLHSADWHLDSPVSLPPKLRKALLTVPERVVALAKSEGCDAILLAGDLFDGSYTTETLSLLQRTLGSAGMPVFIAPGNHDPQGLRSPWQAPGWPENVHIFTGSISSVCLPQLDCRIYGAAFTGSDSPSLLEGFRAECSEKHAVGLFHGDPVQPGSPQNPISRAQVRESGLDYLALGHIHKGGHFHAGDTLCAWPGCPMGRGFDETGEKGVLIVTLDEVCEHRFVPLPLPRFHWLKASPEALPSVLPAVGSEDYIRVDLVGESEPVDTQALAAAFSQFPNLQLRDQTVAPIDLWANAGDDTLEGTFFRMLKESDANPEVVQLAARISRQLLSGQEVAL